jgi:hypothetical protein
MASSPQEQIERYLRSGEHDPYYFGWPGDDFLASSRHGATALRDALITTVRERSPRVELPQMLQSMDHDKFTRAKVSPMVRGLFSRDERDTVLDVLGRSTVFLTPSTIETVLRGIDWLSTAWNVANVYLCSVGAEPLSPEAPNIVGLSEETTCYVSMDYFGENGRFDDFVVHEAAHVFHNCKRETIGLPATRNREWLLEIDYRKRETFAYACEAYARILELGNGPSDRKALLSELERGPMPADERVDGAEYVDILREAIGARNGWKRVLQRCDASR